VNPLGQSNSFATHTKHPRVKDGNERKEGTKDIVENIKWE